MAVHYPGDYGGDGAAGAEIAAEANGLDFTGRRDGARPGGAGRRDRGDPRGQARPGHPRHRARPRPRSSSARPRPQGFTGQFIGLGPTWNPALLATPAAPALEALYLQSGYWGPFGTDTPGHEAMREALGDVEQPNDGYTAGWAWSYPLKAALEEWLDGDYDKDRAGLLEAVQSLETIDYEGMLPEEAGNRSGEPDENIFRASVLSKVDKAAPSGVSLIQDFTVGPTAEAYDVRGGLLRGLSQALDGGLGDRQHDAERAAGAQLRRQVQAPAVAGDDPGDDGEPQAGAGLGARPPGCSTGRTR